MKSGDFFQSTWKVTGADDPNEYRKWAQQSASLGPKGGKTISAILQEEKENDEEARRKKEAAMVAAEEAMADDVLHRVWLKLEERRIRAIDLFRKIDTSADGACSSEEFREGLLWMGFEPNEREFQALMGRLDKDGSGGVSLKEFDRSIKAAERKLVDPEKVAMVTAKRANAAAAALRSARPDDTGCPSCGNALQDDDEFCKACGAKLPRKKSPRKLLGYTPTHAPQTTPIGATDEFMMKILCQMNARKYRSIDFFRTMDRDSSGVVSVEEFRDGLKKMGLKPSKQEFDLVINHLDKDGSGDVTGEEFNKAARLTTKKAKLEGRDGELDSWDGPRGNFLPSTFSWEHRSMRLNHTHPGGSMTERSNRSVMRLPKPWASAHDGPRSAITSTVIGSGSIYDASIHRERLMDSSFSGSRPTSTKMPKLPLHKTVYKKAYFDGRFGKEPSVVPDPEMLRMSDRCPTATRGKFVAIKRGCVKAFHNTPMMQSSVDQVVFNRDMDFSGDSKFDPEFMAMYAGSSGIPSWYYNKD